MNENTYYQMENKWGEIYYFKHLYNDELGYGFWYFYSGDKWRLIGEGHPSDLADLTEID